MQCSTDIQAKVEWECIGLLCTNHIGMFWNRNVWYLIAIFKIIQHLTFSCIQPQEASPLKNSPSIVCLFSCGNGREPNETLKRVLLSSVCGLQTGRGASRGSEGGAHFCMSHCNRSTMDGSLFAASLNSSNEIWSSLFLSILLKILSTLCSGVKPSSFIFIMITVPTIL